MKRYIDAEQLTKDLERLCDIVCQYSKKQRSVMCGSCPLGDAFELLDNQPAADVQEVRHGRWEEADDMPRLDNTFTIRCSLCGQLMLAHPNDENPNFCCNCGASMTDDNAIQHTECVKNALGALAELENGIYGVRDGQVYKMRCATPEELFPNAKKVKINLMAATEEEEDG